MDTLGDRMKQYEVVESQRRFLPMLPIVARLDGKGFSKFTKGLKRPYDIRLSNLMVDTTKYLVEETNAVCGYTQSDEITLAWYSNDYKSQIYFDGRIQKMVSVLAAKCTLKFNMLLPDYIPEKVNKEPVFDCRVWQLPTLTEATNAFLWRELDASKNSISMAASHYYSHKELMNKNSSQKQEMLFEKGVNWNNYPAFFKRGSYVQRKKVSKKLTSEQLSKIPKHLGYDENTEFLRTVYDVVELPPLNKVSNRANVIFFGESPVYES